MVWLMFILGIMLGISLSVLTLGIMIEKNGIICFKIDEEN